jgi:hypothetical protein
MRRPLLVCRKDAVNWTRSSQNGVIGLPRRCSQSEPGAAQGPRRGERVLPRSRRRQSAWTRSQRTTLQSLQAGQEIATERHGKRLLERWRATQRWLCAMLQHAAPPELFPRPVAVQRVYGVPATARPAHAQHAQHAQHGAAARTSFPSLPSFLGSSWCSPRKSALASPRDLAARLTSAEPGTRRRCYLHLDAIARD